MERDSMVFYKSFFEAIKDLPPEEFKKCAVALMEYGLEGKEPETAGIEKTVYIMAKPQIDKNNQRYENGKKGGKTVTDSEPNRNQTVTKPEPNDNQTGTKQEPNCENAEPNVNVNDNVNVNVNDNDNVNDNVPVKEKEPKGSKKKKGDDLQTLLAEYRFSSVLSEKIQQWLDYKRERRETYKPVGLSQLLKKINTEVNHYSEGAVMALMDESMANGWAGIIWDRIKREEEKDNGIDWDDYLKGGLRL